MHIETSATLTAVNQRLDLIRNNSSEIHTRNSVRDLSQDINDQLTGRLPRERMVGPVTFKRAVKAMKQTGRIVSGRVV